MKSPCSQNKSFSLLRPGAHFHPCYPAFIPTSTTRHSPRLDCHCKSPALSAIDVDPPALTPTTRLSIASDKDVDGPPCCRRHLRGVAGHPYQIINIWHGYSLLQKLTTTINVPSTPFYYVTAKIAFNAVESSGTHIGRSQAWIWDQQHHMHDSSQSQLHPDHFHIHRCLMQHPSASSTPQDPAPCPIPSGRLVQKFHFLPKNRFFSIFFPIDPVHAKIRPNRARWVCKGESCVSSRSSPFDRTGLMPCNDHWGLGLSGSKS